MRSKSSLKYTPYLSYELFASNAYIDLKPSSRHVLMFLCLELNMTPQKQRKKYVPLYVNKDEIKLTYVELMDRTRLTRKAIWTAFKDLLEHGFICVMVHGGKAKGDPNIYAIIDDWKAWKKGDIVNEIEKNGKVGWQRAKK